MVRDRRRLAFHNGRLAGELECVKSYVSAHSSRSNGSVTTNDGDGMALPAAVTGCVIVDVRRRTEAQASQSPLVNNR